MPLSIISQRYPDGMAFFMCQSRVPMITSSLDLQPPITPDQISAERKGQGRIVLVFVVVLASFFLNVGEAKRDPSSGAGCRVSMLCDCLKAEGCVRPGILQPPRREPPWSCPDFRISGAGCASRGEAMDDDVWWYLSTVRRGLFRSSNSLGAYTYLRHVDSVASIPSVPSLAA